VLVLAFVINQRTDGCGRDATHDIQVAAARSPEPKGARKRKAAVSGGVENVKRTGAQRI
jgi:hypothetical protein